MNHPKTLGLVVFLNLCTVFIERLMILFIMEFSEIEKIHINLVFICNCHLHHSMYIFLFYTQINFFSPIKKIINFIPIVKHGKKSLKKSSTNEFKIITMEQRIVHIRWTSKKNQFHLRTSSIIISCKCAFQMVALIEIRGG